MDTEEIRASLEEAIRAGSLLDVSRSCDEHRLTGFVVGVGAEWLLLHQVNTDVMVTNGYTAIRRADVTETRVDGSFVPRALSLRGERGIPLPGVRLDALPELLAGLAERFPLVNVHTERRWPDTCRGPGGPSHSGA
jgi:hypothetical protein